ncbi:MAG TPA: agmatine deiminase family protein, partial [Candidatus Hydrogenedentes bacterium]|nr:agmatine deiminase family protein [Candidatus Hydrogenedentota bacterium]
ARYPNHLRDAQWAGRYVREMALPFQEASWRGVPVVLEGGAVDSNGAGVLLATEECLLDSAVQTRNPGMSRRDYEDCFREYLGIRQVIWLNKGIIGDDTHGHVDDVCRFVGQNQVLLCREASSSDPNYVALEENRERLEGVKLPDGAKLEIISLPMPQPVVFDRVRLPASYANFLITNETVLVPTFNDPADRFALGIIAECFPDREVRGIHAVDLVWGLGTIHCLTKEEQLI